MAKFKCKKCAKMITIIDDQEEQVCPYCNTIYEYIYDSGWKYEIKGYRTRKCLYCKNKLIIKNDSEYEGENIEKYQCENCGNTNLIDWLYGDCTLVPCDFVNLKCAWCNETISMDISETTQKWIETKEGQLKQALVTCPHCEKTCKALFRVGAGYPLYDSIVNRVQMYGRKKKVTAIMVEQFVRSNSIYMTYNIIHPYSVYDFCEKNHFDENEVFDIIDSMKITIFSPIDMKELDVHKYENEFSRLKLKEDAMSSAGGASLSGLMGHSKAWKGLRNILLIERDFTCEICGYHTNAENAKTLHVHEEWEQNGEKVTLKKVSLICARCHACKHVNNFVVFRVMDGESELVEGIPRIDFITIHLMKVNNVKKEVIYAYRKLLRKKWREFEGKKRDNFFRGVADEPQEYRYIISENIPNRDAIVECLSKKDLLYKE